jgi:hypothetical protein
VSAPTRNADQHAAAERYYQAAAGWDYIARVYDTEYRMSGKGCMLEAVNGSRERAARYRSLAHGN